MLDNFLDYRKMLYVQRMPGQYKTRSYNLFEHSYGVLILFQYFAKQHDVEYDLEVLDKVIHHDSVEILSGDMNFLSKNFNNKTKIAWEIIEKQLSQGTCYEQYTDVSIRSSMNDVQFYLFKSCDLLDLFLYCKEEYEYGNHCEELVKVLHKCKEIVLDFPIRFYKINNFIIDTIKDLGV